MTVSNFTRSAVVGLIAAAGIAVPATAEVDFSGKTIEWVIPFSETGGSAKWANFFAPLLAEELPGNPTVVVKFHARRRVDPRVPTGSRNRAMMTRHALLFGTSGSTQFPYLLNDPRVRYEYNDWNPVMASGTGGVAYLNAEDGAKFDGSANGLKDVDFIYGSTGRHPAGPGAASGLGDAGHERGAGLRHQGARRRAPDVRTRRSDDRLPDLVGLPGQVRSPRWSPRVMPWR